MKELLGVEVRLKQKKNLKPWINLINPPPLILNTQKPWFFVRIKPHIWDHGMEVLNIRGWE